MMPELKEKEQIDELSAYQGKWKNVGFLKDGSRHPSRLTYDSEGQAKDWGDAACAYLRSFGRKKLFDCPCGCNRNFTMKEYSHTIQIPFKEE